MTMPGGDRTALGVHDMFKMLLAPVALAAMAVGAPIAAQAQPSAYPVTITGCGPQAQLNSGSSAFSGSVIPGPAAETCIITFSPSPFTTILSGFNAPAAPLCAVQISQGHVKKTVQVTASGLLVKWDQNDYVDPAPVNLISWQCYYPWTPNP